MKVAVVHGQAHKGNTYHLTHMLLEKLDCEKTEISEFYVNGIGHCTGCFQCIWKDEKRCPHRSLTEPVIEAIEAADVVILATPNYVMGMSGQLKTFCDHMGYRWMSHRPGKTMGKKIGVAVCTAAGAGARKVTGDIENQFVWWGIGKIIKLPFIVSSASWAEVKEERKRKLEKKTSKLAKMINRKAGEVKPGFRQRLYFQIMKAMQKGMAYNPTDTAYWRSQGWIK